MSVREEDRQKNSCPSRGLGVAAAAIGVGVGAALYYFFSKRQENPNTEGSTSEWNCEQPQTFHFSESDDSYITISEHETTDTSIITLSEQETTNTSFEDDLSSSSSSSTWSDSSETFSESADQESSTEDSNSSTFPHSDSSMISIDVLRGTVVSVSSALNDTFENRYLSWENAITSGLPSDSEVMEWDVTTSSLDVPEDRARSPFSSLIGRIGSFISPRRRRTEDEQFTAIRQQAFRERSWTLEECSICFDVMLRNQEVTSLPCAHNFHTECIMPWLQEKQTCPNCRKVAE